MTVDSASRRPFEPSLVAELDRLAEQLRGQADPNASVPLPLPGGDPALLEASADAATLLSRLLAAIVAFDAGEEAKAEDLVQSTGVLMHAIRANTGL